ncbi:hypothetical protein [Costertonia aggregata]|uniref:Uncharacterized protein n=1 Tax=Costertonia aggregata TaxID=343403 RepID=A0A7H9ARI0_9FLAO|nr:hypothetical protein [Costertonia aggregata]QLG46063.1 hypothetical protein HYG79_12140 [Costertonia aggregata]
MAIISALLLGFYFGAPPVIEYIDNSDERKEQRYLRELQQKKEFERKLDSIDEVRRIEKSELFIYKNNQINDLISYLERRLPESSHITIWNVHNHGGVPKTGNDAEMSVLYTVDNVKGVNIKKEYLNYPLHSGYSELAYQMIVRGGKGFYVKDVSKNRAIYIGETKNNMDYVGTKSIYGAWIKSSSTATYYISVSFPVVDGMQYGGYGYSETLILNARNKLINLLDTE